MPIQIYRRIHPAIVRLCVDDLRARDDLRAPYNGLGRAKLPLGRSKQLLRKAIHFLSYHFILKRRRTTVARVAGFRLTVRPTVFHPRYFLTSKFFANFLAGLDLNGKRVADVGTGSGILALAAARAGAANVIATDINPNAAETAAENARANGLGTRVTAVASDLLSALTPLPIFDVILSSPPSFAGEPRDMADQAWHAHLFGRDCSRVAAAPRNSAHSRLCAAGAAARSVAASPRYSPSRTRSRRGDGADRQEPRTQRRQFAGQSGQSDQAATGLSWISDAWMPLSSPRN